MGETKPLKARINKSKCAHGEKTLVHDLIEIQQPGRAHCFMLGGMTVAKQRKNPAVLAQM
jgi:hypothetical protein